jgi:hypothetical protein
MYCTYNGLPHVVLLRPQLLARIPLGPHNSLPPDGIRFLDVLARGKCPAISRPDHHRVHLVIGLNQRPDRGHFFNHLAVETVHSVRSIYGHRGHMIVLGLVAYRFEHSASHGGYSLEI